MNRRKIFNDVPLRYDTLNDMFEDVDLESEIEIKKKSDGCLYVFSGFFSFFWFF